MIEPLLRDKYQKLCIDPLIQSALFYKIFPHPHAVTVIGCLFGVATLPLLALNHPLFALLALAISGFLDTLDGSLARLKNQISCKGAALDIVCDRIVEFAIVLALYSVDTTSRALPTLLMLGAILICVTSFLVVGIFTENRSEKSFHYSPGLIERAEAFIFFSAMILIPSAFYILSYLFAILVFLTAGIRIVQFFNR